MSFWYFAGHTSHYSLVWLVVSCSLYLTFLMSVDFFPSKFNKFIFLDSSWPAPIVKHPHEKLLQPDCRLFSSSHWKGYLARLAWTHWQWMWGFLLCADSSLPLFLEETGAQLKKYDSGLPGLCLLLRLHTPRAEALRTMRWVRHSLRDMGSGGHEEENILSAFF